MQHRTKSPILQTAHDYTQRIDAPHRSFAQTHTRDPRKQVSLGIGALHSLCCGDHRSIVPDPCLAEDTLVRILSQIHGIRNMVKRFQEFETQVLQPAARHDQSNEEVSMRTVPKRKDPFTCVREDMPFLGSSEGAFGYGRPVPAAAPVALGGSLSFAGTASSYLTVGAAADLAVGSGNFTIEWYQYATTVGNSFPRVFSIGSYSSQSIANSQEGSYSSRIFYSWISAANGASIGNVTNRWIHFAMTRSGTNFYSFSNGSTLQSLVNSTNFTNTGPLAIGNEPSPSAGAAFKGYITNFRWVKGTALYTAPFNRPTQPLTAVAGTSLLLLASTSGTVTTDSSGTGKTVTNTGVTWVSNSPF